jgi:uncharacterized protein (DUF4415 family)
MAKKKKRGRPRLPAARRRQRVVLYVPGEVIEAFRQRARISRNGKGWRRTMADFLEAAVKGWESRNG